ncbi:MAG TPA: hypothetical protein VE869_02685 [Gemmatimonas sp.]|nr:hypothetical protein [Gemmatimonas sp.]
MARFSTTLLLCAGAAGVALTATVHAARAQVAPGTPAGAPGAPAGAAPSAAAAGAPTVGPPIRKIETAQFLSTEPLGAITGVRHLSDGRVMLNDGTRRRLMLLDSSLKFVRVVLDSLTDVENAYGIRAGTIIPYLGDSTVYIDQASLAMLVLDPAGRIARVRSVPRAQDAYLLSTLGSNGFPGFDSKGRLLYRVPAQRDRPKVAPPPGVPYIPQQPDSSFIVGVSLDTRKVDTIASVRSPKITYVMRQAPEGMSFNTLVSPLPIVDDWAVLPDGTLAIVRGIDYRVDWIAPDGTSSSSPKQPYPWVQLGDEDKTRMMDSVKTAQLQRAESSFAMQMIAWSNLLNKPYPKTFAPPANLVLTPGLPRDWILPKGVSFPANYTYGCPPGVTPSLQGPMPAAPAAAGAAAPGGAIPPSTPVAPPCMQNIYAEYYGQGYTPPAPTYRAPLVYPAAELPDYKPPFGLPAIRADADGNLWVRVNQVKPVPGGAIFDLVNRKGEMYDRIQLPVGYNLAGFGPGKIVYLTMRDATGLHLAKVRLQ